MVLLQNTSFSPSELAYIRSSLSLKPPIRPDARSPTSFRPLIAETDLLASANGSARLCFADGAEGIVGVKAEVERTASVSSLSEATTGAAPEDRGDEKKGSASWISVTIDLPGQRDDDSTVVSLSHMIHEGLALDRTLLERLRINRNWHWKLYIDILLLSPSTSYPLPLLSLSTHLALLSSRLPCLISQGEEDPLFNDDWQAAILLYPPPNSSGKAKQSNPCPRPPLSLMVASVGSNIFFDPSREELAVADAVAVLTITSTQGGGTKVVAIRSIDSPANFSTASDLAGAEKAQNTSEDSEGVWRPKRGGMTLDVVRDMVQLSSKLGGVGDEILAVLEAFVGGMNE